jgi:hypothetical protein
LLCFVRKDDRSAGEEFQIQLCLAPNFLGPNEIHFTNLGYVQNPDILVEHLHGLNAGKRGSRFQDEEAKLRMREDLDEDWGNKDNYRYLPDRNCLDEVPIICEDTWFYEEGLVEEETALPDTSNGKPVFAKRFAIKKKPKNEETSGSNGNGMTIEAKNQQIDLEPTDFFKMVDKIYKTGIADQIHGQGDDNSDEDVNPLAPPATLLCEDMPTVTSVKFKDWKDSADDAIQARINGLNSRQQRADQDERDRAAQERTELGIDDALATAIRIEEWRARDERTQMWQNDKEYLRALMERLLCMQEDKQRWTERANCYEMSLEDENHLGVLDNCLEMLQHDKLAVQMQMQEMWAMSREDHRRQGLGNFKNRRRIPDASFLFH